MENVSDYKMVTSTSSDDLNKRINALLQDGYKLYGSPVGLDAGVGQALIKCVLPPPQENNEEPPVGPE